MKQFLQRTYISIIITGVLSIVFGLIAFAWPGITVVVLVWLFAITVITQGIVQTNAAYTNRKSDDQWWLLLLIGMVNIAAGILAVLYPAVTAKFMVMLMAITWLFTGVLQLLLAIRLRKEIRNEGWLALSGLLSVAIAILLLARPAEGVLAMVWVIAAYAVMFGLLLIAVGLKAKNWSKDVVRKFEDMKQA